MANFENFILEKIAKYAEHSNKDYQRLKELEYNLKKIGILCSKCKSNVCVERTSTDRVVLCECTVCSKCLCIKCFIECQFCGCWYCQKHAVSHPFCIEFRSRS